MYRIEFVYSPKSGDRIFIEKECKEVRILKWANCSRHIVGTFAELVFPAAEPGYHWRTDAKLLASAAIKAEGGLAWDVQGTIHVVIPTPAIGRVWEFISLGFPEGYDLGATRERFVKSCLEAGVEPPYGEGLWEAPSQTEKVWEIRLLTDTDGESLAVNVYEIEGAFKNLMLSNKIAPKGWLSPDVSQYVVSAEAEAA